MLGYLDAGVIFALPIKITKRGILECADGGELRGAHILLGDEILQCGQHIVALGQYNGKDALSLNIAQ